MASLEREEGGAGEGEGREGGRASENGGREWRGGREGVGGRAETRQTDLGTVSWNWNCVATVGPSGSNQESMNVDWYLLRASSASEREAAAKSTRGMCCQRSGAAGVMLHEPGEVRAETDQPTVLLSTLTSRMHRSISVT
eukprot:2077279-Rhodomonas_salina.2